MYALLIDQPNRVGKMVVTFAEEGPARLVEDRLNASGDERTTATFLGWVSKTHVTCTLKRVPEEDSCRRQLMACYEAGLTHRIAYDVIDLQVATEGGVDVASGYVLGGLRREAK